MILSLLAGLAAAQSCSCSIGTTDLSMPMGRVPRPGAVMLDLGYAMGQTGGETWVGVVEAEDRGGNSMADMAMPGHLVQTGRLGATVGLPAGTSATVTVPYSHSRPLFPSDMVGDVPRGFVGDTALTLRAGRRRGGDFASLSLGLTLPTGPVIEGFGVRGGRGVVGGTLGAQLLHDLSPVVAIGGSASASRGLKAADDTYVVAPSLDLTAGVRGWTREQGRLSLAGYGVLQHRSPDTFYGLMLPETGLVAAGFGAGADWRFWAHQMQAASLALRGTAPLWQVVGDPWHAENFTASLSMTFTAR